MAPDSAFIFMSIMALLAVGPVWGVGVLLPEEVLGFGELLEAELSPDGSLLAALTGSGLYILDLNGSLVSAYQSAYGLPLLGVAWSPHGSMVAVVLGDGRVVVLGSANMSVVTELDYGVGLDPDSSETRHVALAWSPNGTYLALGGLGEVHILDPSRRRWPLHPVLEPGQVLGTEAGSLDKIDRIEMVSWSPGGLILLSTATSTSLYAENGVFLHQLEGGYASLSPSGSRIASILPGDRGHQDPQGSGDSEGSVFVYEAESGLLLASSVIGESRCLVWDEDEGFVVVGMESGEIVVVSSLDGSVVSMGQPAHVSGVRDLSLAGGFLASASRDPGELFLWVTAAGSLSISRMLRDWGRAGRIVSWLPADGGVLAYGDRRDPVRILQNHDSGQMSLEVAEHRGNVVSSAISADGKMIALCVGSPVEIRDAAYGALFRVIYNAQALEAYDLSWNPANPQVLAIAGAGGVEVWDVTGQDPLARMPLVGTSRCVAWSPCGGYLAFGSRGDLQVWDPWRGLLLASAPTWTNVWSLAWSPNGEMLASLAGFYFGDAQGEGGLMTARIQVWALEHVEDAGNVEDVGGLGDIGDVDDGDRGSGYLDGSGMSLLGGLVVERDWEEPLSRCLSWSPNSTMVAVATGVEGGKENPGIVILDTTGQGLREVLWLLGSLGPAYSVSWSWDGSRVLGGSSDGSIRIWRVGPSLPVREASLLLLPVVVLLAAAPSSLMGSGQSSPFLGRHRRAVQL